MEKIGVIFGRFQPLTISHYHIIDNIVNQYNEAFVFVVQGDKAFLSNKKTPEAKKKDLKSKIQRNPFPVGIRVDLILKNFHTLNDRHVLKVNEGNLEKICECIADIKKTKKLAITIWCGIDEYSDYQRQASAMHLKDNYKDFDIDVCMFDDGSRVQHGKDIVSTVSASHLRKFILANDYESYKRMSAPYTSDHETFIRLKRLMERLIET